MVRARPRSFFLSDGLVLVAVTAGGFAWWRILEPHGLFYGYLDSIKSAESLRVRLSRTLHVVNYLYPMVVTWTVGLLFLRLRRPRPSVRRLARQPGFAAECAVVAGLLVTVGELTGWRMAGCGLRHFLIMTLRGQSVTEMLGNGLRVDETIQQIASAVGAVWGLMALGGVLLPERSWIDRGGRVLGVLWIAMYLIRICTMESD